MSSVCQIIQILAVLAIGCFLMVHDYPVFGGILVFLAAAEPVVRRSK